MNERGVEEYEVRPQRWRIREWPEALRPREEFERLGAQGVSDTVLLALILRTGTAERNVVEVAQQLLAHFGSLTALAKAPIQALQALDGIGPVKAQMIQAALELAQRLGRESVGKQPVILGPEQAAAVLRERARLLDREVLWGLFLNRKSELLCEPQQLSEGTFSSSLVDPKVIFKEALARAAHGLILVHNHPSGDPTPSRQDISVTKQLIEAGRIMDIQLLDHVVLGRRQEGRLSDYISLREAGLVEFG